MSHAANIRNRQRPESVEVPSKRRKTSSSSSNPKINGVHALTNGTYSSSTFTVVPKKDAKAKGVAHSVESNAKIRPADEEPDVEMADDEEMEVSGAADSDEDSDESIEDGSADEEDAVSDQDESEVEGSDEEILKDTAEFLTNGILDKHGVSDEAEAKEEEMEPSFADILRSKGQGTIDVQSLAVVADPSATALAILNPNRNLPAPTATSLGTVLTQALKTNDVDLLESCFQVQNLDSIRATIERLQSSHATSLLQRLAERLHKRPGRAGSLMVWVQWTVVAHGGYLASQPAAMKELHTLYQVVRQRATGLQPLLALKGKLDMLEAQMELRRNMQTFSKTGVRSLENVTYVEGQESSDDETTKSATQPSTKMEVGAQKKKDKLLLSIAADGSEEESDVVDSDEDMDPLHNGLDNIDGYEDGNENDESDDDDDDDNLIDDEAEETDDHGSVLLSDEIDYNDVDGAEAESEEEEPAPKRSKKTFRA